jgi:hypothetical protein
MRVVVSGLAAFLALFVMSAVNDRGEVAEAAIVTFEVRAVGAQENPPVPGPGSAFVRFNFDDVTRQLRFAVTVSGLSPNLVTAAHIHRGAVGVNGPIIHFISATGFTQVEGTIVLSEADVADLRAGNLYFNVHSVENPGGFARGQLILPPAPVAPIVVVEQPRPAAPIAPPRTGSAGLLNDHAAGLAPLAGVIAMAIAGVSVFALAAKRR